MSKYKIGDIIDKDNYKSALTILNNEIALNSNNGDLYRWRGRAKYFLKKYLIENTSNKGFKAIAHDDFAKFYSIDKFQESIDDYNIAIELNKNDYMSYFYMADSMELIEDKNICYDAVIQINPKFIEPYNEKIGWNLDFRRFPDAIKTMHLMIENNPCNKEASIIFNNYKYHLGKTYERYK